MAKLGGAFREGRKRNNRSSNTWVAVKGERGLALRYRCPDCGEREQFIAKSPHGKMKRHCPNCEKKVEVEW